MISTTDPPTPEKLPKRGEGTLPNDDNQNGYMTFKLTESINGFLSDLKKEMNQKEITKPSQQINLKYFHVTHCIMILFLIYCAIPPIFLNTSTPVDILWEFIYIIPICILFVSLFVMSKILIWIMSIYAIICLLYCIILFTQILTEETDKKFTVTFATELVQICDLLIISTLMGTGIWSQIVQRSITSAKDRTPIMARQRSARDLWRDGVLKGISQQPSPPAAGPRSWIPVIFEWISKKSRDSPNDPPVSIKTKSE